MHKLVNTEDQRLAFKVKLGKKLIKRCSSPDGLGHLLKEMLPVHICIPSVDLLFGF